MDRFKKMAAAVAALQVYLKEREATEKTAPGCQVSGLGEPNLWGLASRQDLMAQRRYWQFRYR